jgi:hypothetical protein
MRHGNAVLADGTVAMTGNLDMGGNSVSNAANVENVLQRTSSLGETTHTGNTDPTTKFSSAALALGASDSIAVRYSFQHKISNGASTSAVSIWYSKDGGGDVQIDGDTGTSETDYTPQHKEVDIDSSELGAGSYVFRMKQATSNGTHTTFLKGATIEIIEL